MTSDELTDHCQKIEVRFPDSGGRLADCYRKLHDLWQANGQWMWAGSFDDMMREAIGEALLASTLDEAVQLYEARHHSSFPAPEDVDATESA